MTSDVANLPEEPPIKNSLWRRKLKIASDFTRKFLLADFKTAHGYVKLVFYQKLLVDATASSLRRLTIWEKIQVHQTKSFTR